MNYYISRAGQQYGPYSLEDLKSMSAQGRVDANDLAWGEGMASWTPVSQVLGSAPAAAATPQPYSPPAQAAPQPQPEPQAQPQQYTPAQQYTPQQQYAPQQQYGQPQQQYGQPQQQYGQPQQQYGQPQQQYAQTPAAYGAAAAPAYGAPAYNAGQAGYAPQPMAGGPMPPNMHWALVLVLTAVTGIFGIIWMFMELSFVKKIDPASKAMKLYIFAMLTLPIGLIVGFGLIMTGAAVSGGSSTAAGGAAAIGGIILFAAYICTFVFAIMAVFGMRRSIETYYNTVEPIGLKLSGVMTFFFNMLYFQYHFSRIATWKQTGRLM